MHAVLFYTATIAFALGIFIRSIREIGLPEAVFGLLLALVCAVIGRRWSEAPSSANLLVCSVALLFCSLGIVRMEIASWWAYDPLLDAAIGEQVILEGVIDREPDERASATHLYLDTGDRHILVITERFTDILYGDRVMVTGTLEVPESFETDFGRTFNYPGYLLARDVAYTIRYAEIEHIESGRGNPVVSYLLRGKHVFMQALEKVIPEPQVGLGEGLLLGVKRALGQDLEAAFRTTGIIHIVVLSGYNVMLVVGFVMYGLAFVFDIRMRAVVGVLAVMAFALLVGLSATVVRASIMAALFLIAQATGQTYAVMRALLCAGCIMLFLNPYLLVFDTGFQLSFVATVGLILAAPMLEMKIVFMPNMLHAREFVTATLATQIYVLPLLLYQIGEFSVVAVVVNLLVLPMVALAMLLTFLAGILALLAPILALPLAYAAYLSLSYILTIASWFAAFPFASFVVPAFPFWVMLCMYALLGYGTYRYITRVPDTKSDIARTDMLKGWTIVSEEELMGVKKLR